MHLSNPDIVEAIFVGQASHLNSLPACDYFCSILITYVNSLDPDQAGRSVGPDLDPNCLTHQYFS